MTPIEAYLDMIYDYNRGGVKSSFYRFEKESQAKRFLSMTSGHPFTRSVERNGMDVTIKLKDNPK